MYYDHIIEKEKKHNTLEIQEDNGVKIFHHNYFDRRSSCIFISGCGEPVTEQMYQEICSGQKEISEFYHAHDCFFLVYVLKGENLEFIEDTPLVVTENDLLLITPYTRHHNIFTSDSKILFIHINPRRFIQLLLPAVMENIVLSDFFSDFLNNRYVKKSLLFKDCISNVKWILDKLMEEYLAEDLLHDSYIQYLLGTLMIELARNQSCLSRNFSDASSARMKEVLQYITRNFKNTSLTRTASHFGYNPAYLSRCIHNFTGKTFRQLITDYRLNLAVILIEQQNISIEEVAYTCGYQEISTFYKAFHKRFHCAPRELAAQIKKESGTDLPHIPDERKGS